PDDRDLLVVTIPVIEGVRLIDVMRALDDAGIDALDVTRREVTLDDVFLTLTGSRPDPDPDTEAVTDEPAPARRGAA
ncbi:MAG: hypothetical protein ACXV9S_17770, partial [Acidimicrobiia bacterium]